MKTFQDGLIFFVSWMLASFVGMYASFFVAFLAVFALVQDTFPLFELAYGVLAASGITLGQYLVLNIRHSIWLSQSVPFPDFSFKLPLNFVWLVGAALKWGMLIAIHNGRTVDALPLAIGLLGAIGEAFSLRQNLPATRLILAVSFATVDFVLFAFLLSLYPNPLTLGFAFGVAALDYGILINQSRKSAATAQN
jgi:hypothetical protein